MLSEVNKYKPVKLKKDINSFNTLNTSNNHLK